jgi:hypothetical protein
MISFAKSVVSGEISNYNINEVFLLFKNKFSTNSQTKIGATLWRNQPDKFLLVNHEYEHKRCPPYMLLFHVSGFEQN